MVLQVKFGSCYVLGAASTPQLLEDTILNTQYFFRVNNNLAPVEFNKQLVLLSFEQNNY